MNRLEVLARRAFGDDAAKFSVIGAAIFDTKSRPLNCPLI
jgi:hypothetical protein